MPQGLGFGQTACLRAWGNEREGQFLLFACRKEGLLKLCAAPLRSSPGLALMRYELCLP